MRIGFRSVYSSLQQGGCLRSPNQYTGILELAGDLLNSWMLLATMPYAVKIWVVHVICTFVKRKRRTATLQDPKQQKLDVLQESYVLHDAGGSRD